MSEYYDRGYIGEPDDDDLQISYENHVSEMKSRYDSNKKSKVGSAISCASCGREIIKKSYQSQFCSNKGNGNCKDHFWNRATDKRRSRSVAVNL